jgi:hypothetical protein
MYVSLRRELAALLPAWWYCAAAPLLPLFLVPAEGGRFIAVITFLASGVSLAAYAFRPAAEPPAGWAEVWSSRMTALGGAALASFAVFAAAGLLAPDRPAWVRPAQALASLVPALCVTPSLTMTTRKPVAAVVFTLALVGATKLIAGALTCLVYGWDAPEQGRTTMPWENPDFLLWVFWAANLVLAATGFALGVRRSRVRREPAPGPE